MAWKIGLDDWNNNGNECKKICLICSGECLLEKLWVILLLVWLISFSFYLGNYKNYR